MRFKTLILSVLLAFTALAAPIPMVVFTDPGFDVDDEAALLVAAALQKRGLISLRLVVATTEPSDLRARLAKGVLQQLGLPEVPVVAGDSACPEGFNPHPERLQTPFLAPAGDLSDDSTFPKVLDQAPDASVVLLVLAKMTDANRLLQAEPELCQRKVQRVVIMGGVEITPDGFRADHRSTNNIHDQKSADEFYARLQTLQIPVTIVTRHAATATPIPPDFFETLKHSGHPVAEHLSQLEGLFLNDFWQAARQGKLGPQRDEAWFLSTFCYPNSQVSPEEDIRPHLKSRVLYDAIALLAAVKPEYFQSTSLKGAELIGLSPESPGLKDPQKLAAQVVELAKEATLPLSP